jgi:hypothetical protein
MGEATQDRWAAASGLAALLVGAVATMFERGNPGSDASTDMVAAFFGVHRDALLAQSVLFLIGAGLLLWFVGGLRSYLIRAEGDSGRYSTLVFGASVGYIALSVVAQASQVALAQTAGGTTSSELVAAVSVLSWALFTVAAVPVTVARRVRGTHPAHAGFPGLAGLAGRAGRGHPARVAGQHRRGQRADGADGVVRLPALSALRRVVGSDCRPHDQARRTRPINRVIGRCVGPSATVTLRSLAAGSPAPAS